MRPAARARQQQPHRLRRCRLRTAHPAIRLHQQQPRGDAVVRQPRAQPVEVGPHHRDQQRVQHRGRGPLIFAYFGADLGGDGHRQAGVGRQQVVAQALLVHRIGVRVQQGDRNRLRPERMHRRRSLAHGGIGQFAFHAAIGAHAFGDAQPPLPRDQRRLLARTQAIDVGARVTADLQHVAEPVRGDQHAAGQRALQHRIGRDRRAVQQQGDIGQGEAEPASGFGQSVQQADRRVRRRGRHLDAAASPGALVQHLKVGEGAADIDPDPDPSQMRRSVRWRPAIQNHP